MSHNHGMMRDLLGLAATAATAAATSSREIGATRGYISAPDVWLGTSQYLRMKSEYRPHLRMVDGALRPISRREVEWRQLVDIDDTRESNMPDLASPSLVLRCTRMIQLRNLVGRIERKRNPSPAVVAMGFAEAQPILQLLVMASEH